MDIIVLLVLVIIVLIIFKDLKSLIYFLGISDLVFRLIHFIKEKVSVAEFTSFIDKFVPDDILSIFNNYAEGIFIDILAWVYIIIMIMFIFYLIKYLFKRR